MKVKSLSRVQLFVTPWTVAYEAPPSMGFSRQECWSESPFPSPGDLPESGIEPGSPALRAVIPISCIDVQLPFLAFIYSFSSPPSQLLPSMCAVGDGAGSVCPFFLIFSTKSTCRENQGRF